MIDLVFVNRGNAMFYIGKPVRIRKNQPRGSRVVTSGEDEIFSTLRTFDSIGFVADNAGGVSHYPANDYSLMAQRINSNIMYALPSGPQGEK